MWGAGPFILMLVSGEILIGIVGWPLLVASAGDNTRRRVRGVFAYWFGLLGYGVGFVASCLWEPVLPFFCALVGLLVGVAVGNAFGRLVWLGLKPNNEETRV